MSVSKMGLQSRDDPQGCGSGLWSMIEAPGSIPRTKTNKKQIHSNNKSRNLYPQLECCNKDVSLRLGMVLSSRVIIVLTFGDACPPHTGRIRPWILPLALQNKIPLNGLLWSGFEMFPMGACVEGLVPRSLKTLRRYPCPYP